MCWNQRIDAYQRKLIAQISFYQQFLISYKTKGFKYLFPQSYCPEFPPGYFYDPNQFISIVTFVILLVIYHKLCVSELTKLLRLHLKQLPFCNHYISLQLTDIHGLGMAQYSRSILYCGYTFTGTDCDLSKTIFIDGKKLPVYFLITYWPTSFHKQCT